jgi:hypothetical protein
MEHKYMMTFHCSTPEISVNRKRKRVKENGVTMSRMSGQFRCGTKERNATKVHEASGRGKESALGIV